MDENSRNPTLATSRAQGGKNHFLVKYLNEDQRINYTELILKLVRKHEVTDFHIEEQKAFSKPRVLYNMHTVLEDENYSYEKLEEEYLKFNNI